MATEPWFVVQHKDISVRTDFHNTNLDNDKSSTGEPVSFSMIAKELMDFAPQLNMKSTNYVYASFSEKLLISVCYFTKIQFLRIITT